MKKLSEKLYDNLFPFGLFGVFIALGISLSIVLSGCVHTPVVGPNGQTNVVTTIDQNILGKVKLLVEPVLGSVIRRAILNSPQHSAEIGDYVRAAGRAVCGVSAKGQFTPEAVIGAVDQATQGLQIAHLPGELIDAKNATLNLYTLLLDDKLAVNIPKDQWAQAVLQIACDSIDQALRDSGQAGVK